MKPTSAQLRALARRDPALGRVMRRIRPGFPGFPAGSMRRWSRYQMLARAIVFQQLAYRAAATIWDRCCALTPGPGFPRPEELARISDARLRSAGLSRNKALSVRDLAARVADGSLRLRSIHRADDAEVLERLCSVRGIGPWTAQMFLIFKLGRLDVLPTTDLGVQEGLKILDDLPARPTPAELAARGAVWAPLRSVAAWYLWRLVDGEVDW
ncbi:MAG: DNA-3-methyladenine glycosylase 2 family protein [Planctomycetota bacterium]|nr:MAG: DNA-3-methyladenine glycosylase 2 family protein [Planctomycetota bacterium]